MERVLKRVGLSKRTESDVTSQNANATNDGSKIRRRRRSKSRRPPSQENKKTRGLFNIDWESVKDCRSCKSRAITRKFCSKRSDNELYRSNSFKFERFIRGNEESSTLSEKIAVCDEYSLPADHLQKKRPNSIAVPSLSEWNPSSPNEEKIEILETYSNPRDSRQQLSQEEDTKYLTSPDREYSQPYTTEGSSEPSSDEEFFGHQITITKHINLNSPDSITEGIFPQLGIKSPIKVEAKRHPSPYYYGDLFKNRSESPAKTDVKSTKSLDQPAKQQLFPKVARDVLTTKSQNNQKNKTSQKKYRKCASLQSANARQLRARSRQKYQKSSSVDTQSTDSRDVPHELVMPPNRYISPCDCMTAEYGLEDEMTRQRHVYETAFDCRINKSDDDLDQIDQVSNHPILLQLSAVKEMRTSNSVEKNTIHSRRNVSLHCPKPSQVDNNINNLSQEIQNIHIHEEGISGTSGVLSLPLRGFTPSPPSTAPLPTKFHGKELVMNSIRSAPNLPAHQKARLKDLHLPVKSLRGKTNTSSSGSLQIPGSAFEIELGKTNIIAEFKGRPSHSRENKQERIMEIKDRPRKESLLAKRGKENGKTTLLDFRGRRPKYSSTESMTTSSSGGSMESIKSSTSEGNRSTTSSESRHSSSLSSHSSDSAGIPKYPIIQTSAFLSQSNKLHILSPISDKSSQEPISETSDNNRNNNSQKCSPEEVVCTPEVLKNKRRLPQNKNLLNLGFRIGDPEIQGSDSGISIQSREGIKSRFGFTLAEINVPSQPDLSDLPFDMPKLRRRRLIPTQDACTSGSATSVDVRDLPFDMPKLRRRLRIQQTNNESVSQASSSQSVVEADRDGSSFRPNLTLNLGDFSNRQRPCLGLALMGLNLSVNNPSSQNSDQVDTNLPLEKQGWFHGAITRIEAENVLRLLEEGSFLVRNSESAKQDYSLSLKSAKGFMHMRIQKSEVDGCYILGQFSKPFASIPEMIRHFSINRLPIRGAEHMCLLQPVIVQLL
ncbi:uncharacterized protein LOC123685721 [Harmonia axyridis]|uniref:uncharacterized protein LOC123685721 n=1 Tax=Harmonia axyridis TaxID=115357 RepID=UPI001E2783A7|nr:uncharacterized protein LOC123685721 [Harmonia axyridis]